MTGSPKRPTVGANIADRKESASWAHERFTMQVEVHANVKGKNHEEPVPDMV